MYMTVYRGKRDLTGGLKAQIMEKVEYYTWRDGIGLPPHRPAPEPNEFNTLDYFSCHTCNAHVQRVYVLEWLWDSGTKLGRIPRRTQMCELCLVREGLIW